MDAFWIHEQKIPGSGNSQKFFGTSIDEIGDIDSDGVVDLVVGASDKPDVGGSGNSSRYVQAKEKN